jgi:hypothetical protein
MFGISDPKIIIAYGLSIGLAIACIIYGLLNWNKGGGD